MTINRLAIDLSHYNERVDFGAVWAAGVRLVIHKASESLTADDKYVQRRKDLLGSGKPFLWGAYHFGRGSDPGAQVDAFFRFAAPDEHTGLWLDWEVASMTLPQARDFLTKCDARWGRMTGLYSYEGYLNEHLGSKPDDFLGKHPLWFAKYSTAPKLVQASWSKYFLWQYSDGQAGPQPRNCPGISGDVDENDFDGTEADLRAEWDAWMKTGLPNIVVVAPAPTAQPPSKGDRKPLFDVVRTIVLNGVFSQRQVNQLDAALDTWPPGELSGSLSRKTFFDLVRDMTGYGRFTQPQVDALDSALNTWVHTVASPATDVAAPAASAPPP